MKFPVLFFFSLLCIYSFGNGFNFSTAERDAVDSNPHQVSLSNLDLEFPNDIWRFDAENIKSNTFQKANKLRKASLPVRSFYSPGINPDTAQELLYSSVQKYIYLISRNLRL